MSGPPSAPLRGRGTTRLTAPPRMRRATEWVAAALPVPTSAGLIFFPGCGGDAGVSNPLTATVA